MKNKVIYICLVIILLLFNILIIEKEFQNDTFFNISIGEYICENGIDMIDHFSIHDGLEYSYSHWAFDILMYNIYKISGFIGIYIFTIVMGTILGVVLFYILKKKNKNWIISFVCTIVALYMIRGGVAARAQIISFLMFVLEIYFIEEFLEKKKYRYLFFLLILSIIIANFHSAVWPMFFILFLPYIAEYILKNMGFKEENERKKNKIKNKIKKMQIRKQNTKKLIEQLEILESKKYEEKNPYKIIIENNKNTKILIVFAIIMLFSGLCTPTGLSPYLYIIKSMSGNSISSIAEMQPIIVKEIPSFMIFLGIYLLILCFGKIKIKLSDGCLILGLTIMSIISRRYFYLLSILGIIPFSKLIDEFVEEYKINLNKKKYSIFCVLLIILLAVIGVYKNKDKDLINYEFYPFEVAEFMTENLDIDKIRIYNSYNNGSCLMMYKIPVYIDSRLDVYCKEFTGRDIFDDYIKATHGEKHYEEIFKKYNITHVLTYKDEVINKYICDDKNYNLIYKDANENYFLYERIIK